jgi:hypothetical protein
MEFLTRNPSEDLRVWDSVMDISTAVIVCPIFLEVCNTSCQSRHACCATLCGGNSTGTVSVGV